MTKKQKQLKVAFKEQYKSKYLRQEHYSGDYIYDKEDTFLLENTEPFYAELEYVTYETGRSSLHTIWREEKTKREYVAPFGELHSAVLQNKIKNSKIKGMFQFYKQGTSILLESIKLE